MNTSKLIKGLIAGLIATIVLTVLMLIKKMMGVMPELDPVHMMSQMVAQKMGMTPNILVGWVMHFVVGSVAWGGAFAVLNNVLPGSNQILKGISLGVAAWMLMMLGPMPMSGAGFFGLNMGVMAPMMTLVLHIVFGVVLGGAFARLATQDGV